MSNTNVDWYIAGFDGDGKRVYSAICLYDPNDAKNADKIKALHEAAKAAGGDAIKTTAIITADEYNEYLNNNCVRDAKTGKPVPYVAPPPTAAETATAKIAEIRAKYQPQFEALIEAKVKADLMGTDTAALSKQYKDAMTAMATEIKGV